MDDQKHGDELLNEIADEMALTPKPLTAKQRSAIYRASVQMSLYAQDYFDGPRQKHS
jgi:hypothetical protein